MTERLLVDLGADGRAQVSSWPAAEQYPRPAGDPTECVWPLDEQEMADLRWYLEQYLRMPFGVYEQRGPQVAAKLPEWGARIFAALFATEEAKAAYVAARARSGPVEIVLRSGSAERLGLPWELMTDPGRTVPIGLDQVAISRSLQTGDMQQVFTVPGSRLRVLMVISRPAGEADVGYQMIARPLLRRLEAVRGSVDLVVLRPPTLERLGQVLAQAREAGEPFQVVHFDGHGVFGQATVAGAWGPLMFQHPGPQGMLVFEKPSGGSDLVPAGRVAQVLAGAQVPVVVLNACQSAEVGSQVEAAVATRLLQEGVASVVAMAYSVYAVAASEFMAAFYERLFAGDRMAEAVSAGRRRLALRDERPSLKGKLALSDWMVPVLYTRSEVRFPGLRTEREAGDSLDGILDQLREEPETGQRARQGQELVAEGEFVGRDKLLYKLEVAARLQRVVILHGPGGTGKTELAKEFGRWYRDTGALGRPEWVIWHSFEPGVASFGLEGVINTVGRCVFGDQVDSPFLRQDAAQRQATVEKLLKSRRLLLVWDNFESVHEMPDPGQATPPLSKQEQESMQEFLTLVARDGKSTIIITSRSAEPWLGTGFRRVRVGGLEIEEAAQYAEDLLAPYPDTRKSRESRAFGEVMQWLDGHPLSMRLVLPHLDTTAARDLLEGLQGVKALPGEDDGGRTTSLPASIAYSFDHLPGDDQRAMNVLSLLHGVADADVLRAFSAVPELPEQFRDRTADEWEQLLERAAAVGLLVPLRSRMYRIHPALPACLAARWKSEAGAAYGDQRTAAVLGLLSAHSSFSTWLSDQLGSGDAQLAMALLTLHHRMLGNMLGYSLDHHLWEHAHALVQALDEHWKMRGLDEEARGWLDRVRLAVEAPDGTPPDLSTVAGTLWGFAVGSQANRALRAGQLDDAESAYRAILRALEDGHGSPAQRREIAATYHQLGAVAQDRGRLEEAEEWYRKSLTIEEELRNRPGMATSYHQLGRVAQDRGRLEEAEEWYRKSLTIKEELHNRPAMASTYHQLGSVAQDRGQLDEAEEWYRKSLTIKEELHNRPGKATSYHQLGRVAQDRGRLDEAEEWYRKSLTIKEELHNRPAMASTYHQLGVVTQDRGQLDEAEEWYRKSLTIKEELHNRPGMAASYHQLGLVAQDRGRLDEAEEWYRKSLTIEEELHNRPGMAASYGQLGHLAEARGQHSAALEWTVQCVALFEEFPHPATGPGPHHLSRLSQELGIEALERAWQSITGKPLPLQVRQYILASPPSAD
ncbi:tetratricopeptide repeat protein [Streptomyces sp. NBC_01381]|uniref:tetratricopeptide repeat protein n=1 Tax=Streptomyces sp. NBC_01381 TaxID=2903845 RepID=UPI00224E9FD0|nr:tetratricopeptide repeat protein [Streptomyces sp. NBC_01381]MCX4671509.1 tetratricopeptide repeat protein [Streptomyces sp. NBC_01381]